MLAIAHVSNVLGTENPLAEISAMAHAAGAIVVADGAQGAPKLPLDVAALGVDFYAVTGHKLERRRDRGALGQARPAAGDAALPRRRLDDPQGDPRGHHLRRRAGRFEAGTPAIAQAVGMGAAIEWLDRLGMEAVRDHEGRSPTTPSRARRGPRPEGLRSAPRPRRLGPVSFEIDGIHAHDVSEILDRHGVAVRAGHHCAQVLMERLGVAATARASFGVYTTTAEIDRLVDGLEDARRVFGL